MTEVSLREYFEERIKWLKDLMDERGREVDRHLLDLNHENARILASQSRSVSLEKYEAEMKSLNEKIVNLQRSNNSQEGRQTGSNMVWAYVLAISAVLISLASLVVNWG